MKFNQPEDSTGILFTDQYQLTMAQLYFENGLHEARAQFDHFYRHNPDYGLHQAGYCINAGLELLLDWMGNARFRQEDLAYLKNLNGSRGNPLFQEPFLNWLEQHGSFECLSLRAIPEGRVVHPNTPLTIVQGPLAMAQILETALLNQLNFQTLIATKASRIYESGGRRPILEFGLRRAHGFSANAAGRAALIGGADFSSNVALSRMVDLQPKGTHAHSMVQAFLALGGTELDAFQAYADLYPDDCLLLVDTIDTLESGVPNAIKVFERLKSKGHQPLGIRLDSGDLAYLSIQSARMLDEAGFPNLAIVLSNQLDEMVLWQIQTQIRQEASKYSVDPDQLIKRLIYGVGTRLITSAGQSALDGVYKLVALERESDWVPAIKISENPEKTPNPGSKSLWRIYDQRGKADADLLCLDDELLEDSDPLILHHPIEHRTIRRIAQKSISTTESLLIEIFDEGRRVYESPTLQTIREQRQKDIERLDPGVRRVVNPHVYHVSLSERLWELKQSLTRKMRASNQSSNIITHL